MNRIVSLTLLLLCLLCSSCSKPEVRAPFNRNGAIKERRISGAVLSKEGDTLYHMVERVSFTNKGVVRSFAQRYDWGERQEVAEFRGASFRWARESDTATAKNECRYRFNRHGYITDIERLEPGRARRTIKLTLNRRNHTTAYREEGEHLYALITYRYEDSLLIAVRETRPSFGDDGTYDERLYRFAQGYPLEEIDISAGDTAVQRVPKGLDAHDLRSYYDFYTYKEPFPIAIVTEQLIEPERHKSVNHTGGYLSSFANSGNSLSGELLEASRDSAGNCISSRVKLSRSGSVRVLEIEYDYF